MACIFEEVLGLFSSRLPDPRRITSVATHYCGAALVCLLSHEDVMAEIGTKGDETM